MTTWAEITDILKAVSLTHPELTVLRDKLVACHNADQASSLLQQVTPDPDLLNNSWEYRAFHSLSWACISLGGKMNLENALQDVNHAITAFRYTGNSFNEGISCRILGSIYHQQTKPSLALAELERAIAILTPCEEFYESESNYPRESDCSHQIHECRKLMRTIEKGYSSTTGKPGASSQSASMPSWPRANIIIGVQDFVHASQVGKYVLDDELVGEVQLDELTIDGALHRFYSTQKNTYFFTLVAGKEYRWLTVAGNSMNQASPTPIKPGDYVLVDIGRSANVGDIVVAELLKPPTPQERAGIVKRYASQSYRSESTESIPPIPLKEAAIRGVVLAVAKRIDPTTGQPFPPPGTGQTPPSASG